MGYSRRNAFVLVPEVKSFQKFNEWLWEWCEKDAQRLHYKYKVPIQELWETDRKNLLALPEYPFPVFRYEALAGKTVQAKIFFDHIEFYHDHQPAGACRRSYGRNEEICDWTQYVGALLKKPGAVEHTRFFRQLPQLWQELLAQSKRRERKGALRLLEEIVRDGNAGLCEEALTLAAENGRTDADSVVAKSAPLHFAMAGKTPPAPLLLLSPLKPERLQWGPREGSAVT